jgi:hypothetical protein
MDGVFDPASSFQSASSDEETSLQPPITLVIGRERDGQAHVLIVPIGALILLGSALDRGVWSS